MMLWYKVWLESRTRFFVGVLAVTAVAILYVRLHPVLIPQWVIASQQPLTPKPDWLPLGIVDYQFYIWHFLFDYQLQWLWALFAVVLSFGGLGREQAYGTVSYSLGLPVTRKRSRSAGGAAAAGSRTSTAADESWITISRPVPSSRAGPTVTTPSMTTWSSEVSNARAIAIAPAAWLPVGEDPAPTAAVETSPLSRSHTR